MKRLFLSLMVLVAFGSLSAERVSKSDALSKAQRLMPDRQFQGLSYSQARGQDGQQAEPFYIFNAEDDGGFVIVSGDDRTRDILGYAEHGNLDMQVIPDNLRWWLEYYAKAISAIEGKAVSSHRATRAARAEIQPLIQTHWNQSFPYNRQCFINGKSCLTGCVATAMAQIMNYYQYPASVETIQGYSVGPVSTDDLPATTFNWTDLSDDDKAKLCRYCGQAVKMEYDTNASSASAELIPYALVQYFNYSQSVHSVFREGYAPEEWENLIYQELSDDHPVIYSGISPTNYGHTFICDGYKDGLYHVNWGWGGINDGYFVLTVMDSSGPEYIDDTYCEDQSAILGVRPETGGTSSYPLMTVTEMQVVSDLHVTRASASDNFQDIQVSWQMPNSVNSDNRQAGVLIALYQGDRLVQRLAQYGVNQVVPGQIILHTISVGFGAGLDDGTYRIEMVYRDSKDNVYLPQGHGYRYVEAVISGNTLELKNHPLASDQDDEQGTPAKSFPRKIVMEEFTTTSCGDCVVGIETVKRIKEEFPDNFIAIAIHDDDDMSDDENFGPVNMEYCESYPSCVYNRNKSLPWNVDPTTGVRLVDQLKEGALAKITLSAKYQSGNTIVISTTTEFAKDDDEADYRIAYVVLEDQMGPYIQQNNYSEKELTSTNYMYEWTQKDQKVEMKFDNVARGIYDDANGVEGSVPTEVKSGETYSYEYTLDLPSNIHNKANIRIVALLINNETGEIMNADETAIQTMPGDVNGNRTVDLEDINAIVSHILGNTPEGFDLNAADVNGDDKVNVADLLLVINMLEN